MLHIRLWLVLLGCLLGLAAPHPFLFLRGTRYGYGRKIRPVPCPARGGLTGICMFAWDCMKANGTHLDTCMDRFYFGSCCKLPGPAFSQGHEESHIDEVPVQEITTNELGGSHPIISEIQEAEIQPVVTAAGQILETGGGVDHQIEIGSSSITIQEELLGEHQFEGGAVPVSPVGTGDTHESPGEEGSQLAPELIQGGTQGSEGQELQSSFVETGEPEEDDLQTVQEIQEIVQSVGSQNIEEQEVETAQPGGFNESSSSHTGEEGLLPSQMVPGEVDGIADGVLTETDTLPATTQTPVSGILGGDTSPTDILSEIDPSSSQAPDHQSEGEETSVLQQELHEGQTQPDTEKPYTIPSFGVVEIHPEGSDEEDTQIAEVTPTKGTTLDMEDLSGMEDSSTTTETGDFDVIDPDGFGSSSQMTHKPVPEIDQEITHILQEIDQESADSSANIPTEDSQVGAATEGAQIDLDTQAEETTVESYMTTVISEPTEKEPTEQFTEIQGEITSEEIEKTTDDLTMSVTTSAPTFVPSSPSTATSGGLSQVTDTLSTSTSTTTEKEEMYTIIFPDEFLTPSSSTFPPPSSHSTEAPTSISSTTKLQVTTAQDVEVSSSSTEFSVPPLTTSATSTEASSPSNEVLESSPKPTTTTESSTGEYTLEQELVDRLSQANYKDICGRPVYPTKRIVGGSEASFGEWPWQVSVRQFRTFSFLHKCGAALVNENWVITAAHCVENIHPNDMLLRIGEYDLQRSDEPYGHVERTIQLIATHPKFDPRTFEYDLALLRVSEPVVFQPNIIPICIPEDDYSFINDTGYVSGWGRLYENGPLPSVLQKVPVPVITNSDCEDMYKAAGFVEHIPNIFLCAGYKAGLRDSCEGDSGGPLVIERKDKWTLAGIISWGIGCALPDQPGVYTRISEFREWINKIIKF